jgi:PAS domain-containing protein
MDVTYRPCPWSRRRARRTGLHARRQGPQAGRTGLRESEAIYRGIFLNEHSAMLLVDPATGAIVDANPAAVTFYGHPRETLRPWSSPT